MLQIKQILSESSKLNVLDTINSYQPGLSHPPLLPVPLHSDVIVVNVPVIRQLGPTYLDSLPHVVGDEDDEENGHQGAHHEHRDPPFLGGVELVSYLVLYQLPQI